MTDERPVPAPVIDAGDRVGPYRLEDRLGEGGMADVFRAVRERDGAVVALKVAKPVPGSDRELTRRFLREARAAREVSHPHLINVLDVGELPGRPYLTMTLVEGRTLAERISADGPLPVSDVVQITTDLASALDALHEAGIVHRDVKPSNVMLDGAGAAVLADLGLARHHDFSALTRVSQVVGTLDYLAPESIQGAVPEAPIDIYALGCVVFECVLGRPPFGGRSMFAIGMAHLEERPADPSSERDGLSAAFGAVVLAALAKAPGERPPSAGAFADALSAAAPGV